MVSEYQETELSIQIVIATQAHDVPLTPAYTHVTHTHTAQTILRTNILLVIIVTPRPAFRNLASMLG